jgi:hypothetical protein
MSELEGSRRRPADEIAILLPIAGELGLGALESPYLTGVGALWK